MVRRLCQNKAERKECWELKERTRNFDLTIFFGEKVSPFHDRDMTLAGRKQLPKPRK